VWRLVTRFDEIADRAGVGVTQRHRSPEIGVGAAGGREHESLTLLGHRRDDLGPGHRTAGCHDHRVAFARPAKHVRDPLFQPHPALVGQQQGLAVGHAIAPHEPVA